MARLLFALMVLLALGGTAHAEAPQILGVIASTDSLPLNCRHGACAAELSTFCLEERAAVPPRGMEYRIAGGASAPMTLVATDRAGATVRLAAAGIARLTVARGNRAMRLSVDYGALAPRGLRSPRIEVGEGVSLLPAALADQADDPVMARRIEATTGPMRQIALAFVDRAGPQSAAAHLLNRLVNGVPDDRAGDVADRQALWDDIVRQLGDGALSGLPQAREAFERCARLPGGGFLTFRQCLASHHDMLIGPLNRAYWDAVGTGI